MTKNKWEIKSENYFVRIKIKSTEKDGEYYDIVFGLKGQNIHAHYGIKAAVENCLAGQKIFFIEPRQVTSHYKEKTFNSKTGEFLSELDKSFGDNDCKIGAKIHISTEWDENVKKLFIRQVKIIENGFK